MLLLVMNSSAMTPGSTLKKLRNKYRKIESLRAEFRELFEWGMTGETVIREGKLLVGKDNRFKIETSEQVMMSDGVDLYRYNRLKNQVIIEPVNASDTQFLPRKLLLDFTEGFNATEVSQIVVAGREGLRLDLIPEDPETVLISSATLWLTQDDMIVHRLRLVDLNSNLSTFFLSDIQLDRPIDASEIIFVPPEGVELFDLR